MYGEFPKNFVKKNPHILLPMNKLQVAMTHLDLFITDHDGDITEELLLSEVLHFVQHLAGLTVAVVVYTIRGVSR